MEKDLDHHQQERQLLPSPHTTSSSRAWLHPHRPSSKPPLYPFDNHHHNHHGGVGSEPTLDLKLSISLQPAHEHSDFSCVEALKWQAKEQIRLAAIEKAYADRVRELTRVEIELAESEFARARAIWDMAREEVAKADKFRVTAITCMGEITCHSCGQRFPPTNNL